MFITHIATFVAVGVAAGLALSGVPNVELVTAICFMAGYLLGSAAGMLTGALTELLFAGFHPLGSSFGPILLAQVTGMVVVGLLGGQAARLTCNNDSRLRYTISVVVSGILGTLIFDFLTNLAFPIMSGFSFNQTLVSLTAGLPFAAIHLISNTVVFIVVVLPLLPRLQKVLRLI
ncbi:MAG: hypothetical protein ACOZB3_04360 [Calditrichota bacterium]